MANSYERKYRNDFNYTNKAKFKDFLQGKSERVYINWDYIDFYNRRLKDIFFHLNSVVHYSVKQENIDNFLTLHIDNAFEIMKSAAIVERFSRQSRGTELAYFSWMRGYLVCQYFIKSLSIIFNIPESQIFCTGKDDLTKILDFKKAPEADLEINVNNQTVRFEMQSGFSGVNDIKKHKVNEAIKKYKENNIISYVVHFDLFNGLIAFVNISNIGDNDVAWVKRDAMEGQIVFAIPADKFIWKLTEQPKTYKEWNLI